MEQHSHLEGTEFVVMSHELIKIKKEVVEDEIELQKNTNNEYKITEGSGQVTIKNEDDVQSFTNQNADICSNSTANDLASTNIWIKCEPIEELKLENDLDIETCGGTEITEECLIKNEDEHIVKRRRAGRSQKHIICVHCNMTFTINRSLDDHMIRKHPDLIAEVSSKIHACAHCKYKTTRRVRLLQHMLKHPGAEGGYKLKKCVHCNGEFRYTTTLDNHIIQKHPEHIKLVSSVVLEEFIIS
ncbi:unnamed protein product [Acanthoscelides obtectus]|uniref:C2H2-type domain-containing protein n=1 Tax=Acanthoscelides obtectus TaxID=200917 RepID=A0A9P0P840_ACAOB|nr:unnamed protein product [Acanthoscelides obtectus]CAK1664819.1 hypothetical protein AOBTE_LOCUS24484 [Acanthoscelides obtectus]